MNERFWRLSSPEAERDFFCLGDLGTGGGIEFALNDEELVPRKGRGWVLRLPGRGNSVGKGVEKEGQ